MKLFKEVAFASNFTLAALDSIAEGHAHEIRLNDLMIEHPWTLQSPMAANATGGFMRTENNSKEDGG